MSIAMTTAEREEFLAETRIGILGVGHPGHGPLTVPVWYHYTPGGVVRVVTGTGSEKARLLRAAGRMSLCAQTETAPYRYVFVEGPVRLGEPDHERDVRAMALRYLGDQMGEMYLQMTAEDRARDPGVLVEMRPERWRSVDYRKQFA